MRIVILGAGQVGATLARNLANEDNDITLIDQNADKLKELQSRIDIKTVLGNAAYPQVLVEAGIEQADMLIAVTNSDESNMIACQIAYSLFQTPNKIARIRSRHYYQYPEIFVNEHIPVDECISPEQLVTDHIVNLILYPGASEVLDFAEGRLLLVTIRPQEGGIMLGKSLKELKAHLGNVEARLVALFRNEQPQELLDEMLISKGDAMVFLAAPKAIQQVLIALGRYTHPNRRVIIAGGGHIGTALAERLEQLYRIKVVDHNLSRATYLASHLHKATVLQGDIADRDLLLNENIEFTDVFCAVTNDDEANIMACLQAKRLGCRHTMALVNRDAYVDLIHDSSIDQAISPQRITIGCILTKLRRGHMVKVQRLEDEAEAMELILQGNEENSMLIGRALESISLPPSCHIAALVRGEKIFFPQQDLVLHAGDHLILLIMKKRYLRQLERFLQLNLTVGV